MTLPPRPLEGESGEFPFPIDPALRALLGALKEVDRFPLAELPPANAFQARWADELTR